jgi:predicted DNA-binding protein (MmcQ/YjbR family)
LPLQTEYTDAVTLEALRTICRSLPLVTEDVKWGSDLCFCVQKKMFVVVNLDPPHQVSFKCSPESFAELVERPGIVPAPYMARHMWVQEQALGETLDRGEYERLVKAAYALVVGTLPMSRRPGAGQSPRRPRATHRATRARRRRG